MGSTSRRCAPPYKSASPPEVQCGQAACLLSGGGQRARRSSMAMIARLSHVGFNVPREVFDQECEFWEKVIGLQRTHSVEGRNAFFAADTLRDHEFILFAADGPVSSYGSADCM